jgi:hypothetical protein
MVLLIEWQLYCCWSSGHYLDQQQYNCYSINNNIIVTRSTTISLLLDQQQYHCYSINNNIIVTRSTIFIWVLEFSERYCRLDLNPSKYGFVDRVAIILLLIEWPLYCWSSDYYVWPLDQQKYNCHSINNNIISTRSTIDQQQYNFHSIDNRSTTI